MAVLSTLSHAPVMRPHRAAPVLGHVLPVYGRLNQDPNRTRMTDVPWLLLGYLGTGLTSENSNTEFESRF